VRSAVQELPRERAPRSFALRTADIEGPRQAAPSGLVRASPLLGAVASIALVAFFSLVALDVIAGPSGGGGSFDLAAEPMSSQAPGVAEDAADGDAPPEEPVRNGAEDITSGGPQTAKTPLDTTLSFAAEATRAAAVPSTGPVPDVAVEQDDDDDRTGLRAAEAATAAVAVVAGGTFALAWWRRRA
jgi:hypothetical protein